MTERDSGDELHLKAFGLRLRDLRRAQHVTQEQLSERMGIARTRISEMETGKANVTVTMLWNIATALNIHAADLLDDRPS